MGQKCEDKLEERKLLGLELKEHQLGPQDKLGLPQI